MKKSWLYIFSIACIAAVAFISGLEKAQVVSISLFLALILGTLFFWRFRLAFAFIAMALLLGFGVLDIYHLIEFAGLDIVLFLVGMMVVIGFLEEYRFFEILTNKIINIVGNNINKLIIVIMILSALFAALVDEVTSILFMTSTVLHLTGKYRVNPTPYIIMTVFATNIGSSATVVGNPVGVMIALRAGLTFADFLRWASPISILSLIVIIPLTMKYFNKEIKEFENRLTNSLNVKNNFEEIIPRNKFILSLIIFSSTITLLILHNQVEKLLHLEKNTMLLG
ncbi:MAG: SLC13 family permease, partial [Candidatus Anstonellales archaeon]